MANIKKHIKKPRFHSEGRTTLQLGFAALVVVNVLAYLALQHLTLIPFYILLAVTIAVYAVVVNFFRCPIRLFNGETDNIAVAAADGKVVVIEEVEEPEYFKDRRIMVSIFMSVANVHANWFPVKGTVKVVRHYNGNFYKAWLPKASTENERSTVVIETPQGQEVLVRQVAGAMARRIVTYARPGDTADIDIHLGFIKFGSRVDIYLPLDAEVLLNIGQCTVGNQTVVARLSGKK